MRHSFITSIVLKPFKLLKLNNFLAPHKIKGREREREREPRWERYRKDEERKRKGNVLWHLAATKWRASYSWLILFAKYILAVDHVFCLTYWFPCSRTYHWRQDLVLSCIHVSQGNECYNDQPAYHYLFGYFRRVVYLCWMIKSHLLIKSKCWGTWETKNN